MAEVNPAALSSLVVWGAFSLSLLLGWIAAKTNFCTMGAVSDVLNMGDWTRMRMWLLAIAVAILGTAALQIAGWIDVSKSIYTGSNLLWLSHLLGGLLFGIGMVLASGCGSKTLIRLGGGNLKSLVVMLVMAVVAYMSLRGVLGVLRVNWIDTVAVTLPAAQDLPSLAASLLGSERSLVLPWLSGGIALLLLAFVFADAQARSSDVLTGGVVIGLVIVAAWALSGHLGHVLEDPATLEEKFYATNSGRMESMSFVAPQAYLLELLMLWSDKSRVMTLGIASVLGMVCGALLWALFSRSFRIESFNGSEDMLNHMVGAALMGFGGVLALGCTVGQGLSGISTLALGSLLSLLAIIAGAVLGMRYQVWRIERAG